LERHLFQANNQKLGFLLKDFSPKVHHLSATKGELQGTAESLCGEFAILNLGWHMRILLVDDSSFILLVGRRTLEKSGHEVVADAFDGEDGVRKALAFKPDLVIMDIALPKKNGFEASQLILESLPKTKVLAISAIDEEWIREKAVQSGCYSFLAKPFDPIELLEAVEQAKETKESVKYG